MAKPRQLHLGAFMRPAAIHTGAWRYPGADPHANFSLDQMRRSIRRLEAAKFDAFFMADHLALLNMPIAALMRSHTVTSFEPFTLLSALSAVTERIGLIATASTTFDAPYHIARRFASLDHISGGRAGWNVVTTANPDAALNFGYESQMDHDDRYELAREFVDVVTGLWDSFADDAFVRDTESGVFVNPARIHAISHKGPSLKVRGPLNIARPPQGWPVIVQAGASPAGRQLAAETAEVIFGAPPSIEAARSFNADIRSRMVSIGRTPDALRYLPGAFVVVAHSMDEAIERRAMLDSLIHYDSGIGSLNSMLGFDVSGHDPDGPLPEIPETEAGRSQRERMVNLAREKGLTIRELARAAGSYSGFAFVGTATSIADEMQEWLETEASDGFNLMFPWIPGGLDEVVDRLVPELQRRGLFRREYEGSTLREHLGLPRPSNRFFPHEPRAAA
ncbi:LLM class flavin-dependent oxidoreductase [Paraburkholderia phytofirmans]|uniref:Putative nitrilotriacetate monooxygenase component A n=1 Tax=Paraburkholderia phytofirmans (strain DSM 17436 / LMG 22146 / PsJN) TaxID=398527 RepID=B2T949_PARPJ|nr:LLM class flavin-dependent oxidoreductase [Paraburkholderia phytofirmans]ACD20951.1 putative nitrilotriacetate monooxygenase component A [Paraburkholderia phytofirmans PsJN]